MDMGCEYHFNNFIIYGRPIKIQLVFCRTAFYMLLVFRIILYLYNEVFPYFLLLIIFQVISNEKGVKTISNIMC